MQWEYAALAEELSIKGVTTRTWSAGAEVSQQMHKQGDTPSIVSVLNQRGREGWELVGFEMAPLAPVTRYMFKRPIQD